MSEPRGHAVWIDTEVANRTATGWSRWADDLDRTRHDVAWHVTALALGDAGAADALGAACTELWTGAALTGLVAADAVAADAGAAPRPLALLDELAGRFARGHAGAVAGAGEAYAIDRWIRAAPDADIRALFEARYPGGPAAVLAAAEASHAVAYWEALPPDARRRLVDARPDLVVLRVLAAGATLPPTVLDRLDTANAYPVFTERWSLELGVAVGARVVEVELGARLRAVTTKLSDGAVEMVLVEDGTLGAGVDLGAGERELAAGGGAVAELRQRFRFDDEDEALAALDVLAEAARHDVSLGELAADAARVGWNGLVAPVDVTARAGRAVLDGVGLDPVADRLPTVPTFDLEPETLRAIGHLWDDHGVARTEALGTYGDASAEFDAGLAEIEASLERRLMFYDTDTVDGGEPGRSGVIATGIVRADGELTAALETFVGGSATSPAPTTSSGTSTGAGFEGHVVVDLHDVAGVGTFLTVSLVGRLAQGRTAEVLGLDAAEIETGTGRGSRATVEVTVPVGVATAATVGGIAASIAAGRVPVDELDELHEAAELTVELGEDERDTTRAGVDAGVIEVEAEIERDRVETVRVLHKYPGGELYSRQEVDTLIAAARP